ncbi:MAG: hypothetical protein ACE5HR_00005 [bacterium]
MGKIKERWVYLLGKDNEEDKKLMNGKTDKNKDITITALQDWYKQSRHWAQIYQEKGNMNNKTVSEIRDMKTDLEVRLLKTIAQEVKDFQDQSDVLINSIYVSIEDIYKIGDSKSRKVADVRIDLDL